MFPCCVDIHGIVSTHTECVIKLQKAATSVNADVMTTEEIHAKLEKGCLDVEKGKVQDAAAAFAKFRENR